MTFTPQRFPLSHFLGRNNEEPVRGGDGELRGCPQVGEAINRLSPCRGGRYARSFGCRSVTGCGVVGVYPVLQRNWDHQKFVNKVCCFDGVRRSSARTPPKR